MIARELNLGNIAGLASLVMLLGLPMRADAVLASGFEQGGGRVDPEVIQHYVTLEEADGVRTHITEANIRAAVVAAIRKHGYRPDANAEAASLLPMLSVTVRDHGFAVHISLSFGRLASFPSGDDEGMAWVTVFLRSLTIPPERAAAYESAVTFLVILFLDAYTKHNPGWSHAP